MNSKDHSLNFNTDKSAWVNERYIPQSQFDLEVEEITRNGYTILENRLSIEDVAYIRGKIDEVYECQLADFGGGEALIEIGEHGLARNLLEYDEYFLNIITHEDVLALKNFLPKRARLSSLMACFSTALDLITLATEDGHARLCMPCLS